MNASEHIFDAFMLPLEGMVFNRRRRYRLRAARGRVLEVGTGTGANLRHYDYSRITELHLSDLEVTSRVQSRSRLRQVPVAFHEVDVQALPFADGEFDTVVSTLVFCSVADPGIGLGELWRVLRPGGRLVFIEHVKPERGVLRRAVDMLNPAWRSFNGDCNLNRDTLSVIRNAGFRIRELHTSGRGLVVDGVAEKV